MDKFPMDNDGHLSQNPDYYSEMVTDLNRRVRSIQDENEILKDEIKKRKKYEGFLKSQIRCGNDLDDSHTFEWFCELWGDILKD
jgi:hypothetical protein